MTMSDSLLCLFSGEIQKDGDSYVVEIPEHEIETGTLTAGELHRIGVYPSVGDRQSDTGGASNEGVQQRDAASTQSNSRLQNTNGHDDDKAGDHPPDPPVTEGETRKVKIEDIGDQGDGLARVERGYVVIVPGTEEGDEVEIEIDEVNENFAFGDVTRRIRAADSVEATENPGEYQPDIDVE